MAPLYRCVSVQQRFGATLALDLPALTIREGGLHLLIGSNGSGKSTLLGLLAFLAPPTAGEVWFRGVRVAWRRTELLRLRRQATLVHQFPYLFSGSVAHNVGLGLRHRGIARQEIATRVERVLDQVGLAALSGRHAQALSGGEARRVALARAILLEPAVLLLDEPYANLDAGSAAVFDDILAQLTARGCTVVMTSHEAEHIERHRGDVIRLAGGRLASSAAAASPDAANAPLRSA